ncbi:MAG: protein translocase subunit SecD [Deltaproteobacteria bacterium]
MDRSLKWRTVALFAMLLLCLGTLAPSIYGRDKFPTVWPLNKLFGSEINLGLDLQGGKHIVYNIDLDKAIDDKASEIKNDITTRLADDKLKGSVRTPSVPLGTVIVTLDDPSKLDQVKTQVNSDYNDREKTVEFETCPPGSDMGSEPTAPSTKSLCFVVSSSYADGIKKSALTNAVATIRDRINEKGVAEPSVVEKGDDIIVELPGNPNSPAIVETEELIARTAKLEMKVVDDCTNPPPTGCTKDGTHGGSIYMQSLFRHVGSDKKDQPTDPEAKRLEIQALTDHWKPEEGGGPHTDFYLEAPDRDELVPLSWATKHGKLTKDSQIQGDRNSPDAKVTVSVSGREIIDRYLFGDPDLVPPYPGLIATDKSVKLPDDHQLSYELEEPTTGAKDRRNRWRSYYLERAVRLTGSSISGASGTYSQTTNRPEVSLEFNRFGGRVFGDVTSQIVGMKFATILDDKVKSAPTINTAIRGGRASITMGGSDATRMEKERDDLVAVLKTGSLPAPLREASHSDVGPTLGRDAIQKTKFSFELGIALVILIMVGVYRWSGWIAVFAVVFHILLTLAVMAIFGATLTLPGIAAIVLSIGMEVDGNILIYERIRDELNLGKSVRGAIDLGFSRAFTAILDGQLTTAAAGWVLLQYGSGPIKGFAVMLLVGVFTTLTTNIWVTRILFDWNVARKKGNLVTISI